MLRDIDGALIQVGFVYTSHKYGAYDALHQSIRPRRLPSLHDERHNVPGWYVFATSSTGRWILQTRREIIFTLGKIERLAKEEGLALADLYFNALRGYDLLMSRQIRTTKTLFSKCRLYKWGNAHSAPPALQLQFPSSNGGFLA